MPVTKAGLLERLDRNDEWVVARPFGWPISVNKVHAMQYGVAVGFVLGLVAVAAFEIVVATLVVLLLLSVGVSPEWMAGRLDGLAFTKSVDERATLMLLTIEHKPHYFWLPFIPVFTGVWTVASVLL